MSKNRFMQKQQISKFSKIELTLSWDVDDDVFSWMSWWLLLHEIENLSVILCWLRPYLYCFKQIPRQNIWHFLCCSKQGFGGKHQGQRHLTSRHLFFNTNFFTAKYYALIWMTFISPNIILEGKYLGQRHLTSRHFFFLIPNVLPPNIMHLSEWHLLAQTYFFGGKISRTKSLCFQTTHFEY